MKCPYRKNIVHQPDRNEHYIRYFAQDIEEFGNCYENECPFYVDKRCYKAEMHCWVDLHTKRGGEEEESHG